MGQSAYIKLVKGSEVSELTLEELKDQLLHYIEQTAKTGQQLGWDYSDAAFPYTIESKPEGEDVWFYLKGKNENYKYIVMGLGSEKQSVEVDPKNDDEEPPAEVDVHYIQVVLPEECTHGDKSKGNELCKYLANKLKAELHLFNGRVMRAK